MLEIEFLHPGFIGGDGGAFHADAMLLDGIGRVDGYLIVGRIAVFDREIIIVQINIKIRMNQLFLDQIPDDAGHLIAVEFNDRIGNFYLGHYGSPSVLRWNFAVL